MIQLSMNMDWLRRFQIQLPKDGPEMSQKIWWQKRDDEVDDQRSDLNAKYFAISNQVS